jgi:hypothetical protein
MCADVRSDRLLVLHEGCLAVCVRDGAMCCVLAPRCRLLSCALPGFPDCTACTYRLHACTYLPVPCRLAGLSSRHGLDVRSLPRLWRSALSSLAQAVLRLPSSSGCGWETGLRPCSLLWLGAPQVGPGGTTRAFPPTRILLLSLSLVCGVTFTQLGNMELGMVETWPVRGVRLHSGCTVVADGCYSVCTVFAQHVPLPALHAWPLLCLSLSLPRVRCNAFAARRH